MNYNSSLIIKYRFYFEKGDYKEAYDVLNQIEKEYKNINSFKIFVNSEKVKLRNHSPKKDTNQIPVITYNAYFKNELELYSNPNKGILKSREDDQNDWYFNKDLEEYLTKRWSMKKENPLPTNIRRILVIGNDLELKSGVFRSLASYINFLYQFGGYSIKTIELSPQIDPQSLNMLFEAFDLVIINGLPTILKVDVIVKVIKRISKTKPIYYYIHATKWSFKSFKDDQIKKLKEIIPCIYLFLVSSKQFIDIEKIAKPKDYCVINELPINLTKLPISEIKETPKRYSKSIIMTGTIIKRKGFDFFCRCAESIGDSKILFKWAGIHHDKNLKISERIKFLGNLRASDLHFQLKQAEIFFLSSYDDPFPHSAIEAYTCGCKLLIPRVTGLVEIFEGMKGVIIYEEHEERVVNNLIKKLLNSEGPDKESIEKLEKKLSTSKFSENINSFIKKTIQNNYHNKLGELYKTKKVKIAVILHLFYFDLACEFRRQLQSLQDHEIDIYISLPKEKYNKEIEKKIKTYFGSICDKIFIFEVENSGMDIKPFIRSIKFINENKKTYDYILKIHSKKSLQMSGQEEGEKWRKEMLNSLLGNRENVKEIIRIFESNKNISIIAPRNYLIEKSSFDSNNSPLQLEINRLKEIFDLEEKDCKLFVRGTMFWIRGENILKIFREKEKVIPLNFPIGFSKDGSLAHAYERILTYLGTSKGELLKYSFQENKESTGLKSFHNIHQGQDIYVLASGPSLERINKNFFNNKITIGLGLVYKTINITYAVHKEYTTIDNEIYMLKNCKNIFSSLYKSGNRKRGFIMSNKESFRSTKIVYFDHYENELDKFKLDPLRKNSEKLFVSWSTITSAINLAAMMGAKNIILVGHDCGTLNGNTNINEYSKREERLVDAWDDNEKGYVEWLSKIESQTIAVRNYLRDEKKINIVSLNPFINFSLEGNKYSKEK